MEIENHSELKEENKYLKDEIARLKGVIELFKRGQFGSKSERVEELPGGVEDGAGA